MISFQSAYTTVEVLFRVTVVSPGWHLFFLIPQDFRTGVNDMPKSPFVLRYRVTGYKGMSLQFHLVPSIVSYSLF